MCELLRKVQKLAREKKLPLPICPPDVRAVCTGTQCALENILGDSDSALNPQKNLDRFYEGLEKHREVVRERSTHD